MITDEQKEKVLELYQQDKPISHIAKETGVSRTKIYEVIKESGVVEPKESKEKTSTSRLKISEDTQNIVLGMAALNNISPDEQIKLGAQIDKWLYDNGIDYQDFISLRKSIISSLRSMCPHCNCSVIVLVSRNDLESVNGDIPLRCSSGHTLLLDKIRALELYDEKMSVFDNYLENRFTEWLNKFVSSTS